MAINRNVISEEAILNLVKYHACHKYNTPQGVEYGYSENGLKHIISQILFICDTQGEPSSNTDDNKKQHNL